MADVGLHRTDGQRRRAPPAEHGPDGGRLHRIADARAGAVGFHEGNVVRPQPRLAIKALQQRPLALDAGKAMPEVRPSELTPPATASARMEPGAARSDRRSTKATAPSERT